MSKPVTINCFTEWKNTNFLILNSQTDFEPCAGYLKASHHTVHLRLCAQFHKFLQRSLGSMGEHFLLFVGGEGAAKQDPPLSFTQATKPASVLSFVFVGKMYV